jgi:hypothetical protein
VEAHIRGDEWRKLERHCSTGASSVAIK